jgi:hypothetical protein
MVDNSVYVVFSRRGGEVFVFDTWKSAEYFLKVNQKLEKKKTPKDCWMLKGFPAHAESQYVAWLEGRSDPLGDAQRVEARVLKGARFQLLKRRPFVVFLNASHVYQMCEDDQPGQAWANAEPQKASKVCSMMSPEMMLVCVDCMTAFHRLTLFLFLVDLRTRLCKRF